MRWQEDLGLFFRWVDNTVCAFLQRTLEEWDNFCGLGDKAVGEGIIEGDEVGDVDVAVVLAEEYVFADLVSVLS